MADQIKVEAIVEGVQRYVSDIKRLSSATEDAARDIAGSSGDVESLSEPLDQLAERFEKVTEAAKDVDLSKAGEEAEQVGEAVETAGPQVESITESFEKVQESAEDLDLSAAGTEAEDVASTIGEADPSGFTDALEAVASSADDLDLSAASEEAESTASDIADADPSGFSDALEEVESAAGDFDTSAAASSAEETAQAIGDADPSGFSDALEEVSSSAESFDVSAASEAAEETAEAIGDADPSGFSDALDEVASSAADLDLSAASTEAEDTASAIGEADPSGFTDSLGSVESSASDFDVSAASEAAESTAADIGAAGTEAEAFTESLDVVQEGADNLDLSSAATSAEDAASAIGDAGQDAEIFIESLDSIQESGDSLDLSSAAATAEDTAAAIGDAGSDAEAFVDSLDIVQESADDLDLSAAVEEAQFTGEDIGAAGEEAEVFIDSLESIQESSDSLDLSFAVEEAENTGADIGAAGTEAEAFTESLDVIQESADNLDMSVAVEEAETTAAAIGDAAADVEVLSGAIEGVQEAADSVDMSGTTKEIEGTTEAADTGSTAFQNIGTSATITGTAIMGLGGKLDGLKSSIGGIIGLAGLAGLTGVLQGMAVAAAEDEQATIRLEGAIRNSHEPFRETVTLVDALIQKGQDLAFTDDQVRDSFIRLLTATGDASEATERVTLAFDLARGAGITLEAASRLLGKVTEENVNAFKKINIEIGENATEAQALSVVHGKYAGAAEGFANSTLGGWERLSIAAGEYKEQLGYLIIEQGNLLASSEVAKAETTLLGKAFGFARDNAGGLTETIAVQNPVVLGGLAGWKLLTTEFVDNKKETGFLSEELAALKLRVKAVADQVALTNSPLNSLSEAVIYAKNKVADYKQGVADAEAALADLAGEMDQVNQRFIDQNPVVIAAKGQLAIYELKLADVRGKTGELTEADEALIDSLETAIGTTQAIIDKETAHGQAVIDLTGYLQTFVGPAGMAGVIDALGAGELPLANQTTAVQDLGQAFLDAKSGGIDAALVGMQTLQSNLGPMSAEWQAIAKVVGPEFIATLKEGITDPTKLAEIDAATDALGFKAQASLEDSLPGVRAAADALVAGITGSLAPLGGTGSTAGASVGDGLVAGMNSRASAVWTAASALGVAAQTGINSIFRSFSPSQMGEELGESVGQGLVEGLSSYEHFVYLAALSIGSAVAGAFGDSVSGIAQAYGDMFDVQHPGGAPFAHPEEWDIINGRLYYMGPPGSPERALKEAWYAGGGAGVNEDVEDQPAADDTQVNLGQQQALQAALNYKNSFGVPGGQGWEMYDEATYQDLLEKASSANWTMPNGGRSMTGKAGGMSGQDWAEIFRQGGGNIGINPNGMTADQLDIYFSKTARDERARLSQELADARAGGASGKVLNDLRNLLSDFNNSLLFRPPVAGTASMPYTGGAQGQSLMLDIHNNSFNGSPNENASAIREQVDMALNDHMRRGLLVGVR